MKRSVHCESFGIQKVAACACLLALLLVYAPVASATLMSVTGACCTGDQCPIHGNHHPSKHDEPAAMDCHGDKHNVNQMDSCSISCCHTDQRAAVNANIFVLTPISVRGRKRQYFCSDANLRLYAASGEYSNSIGVCSGRIVSRLRASRSSSQIIPRLT